MSLVPIPHLLQLLLERMAPPVDRAIGWPRLPGPLGLALLFVLRNVMRRNDLYDTSDFAAENQPSPEPPSARHLIERTADGSYNDLRHPRMGMAGSRFGRNVPPPPTYPDLTTDLMSPNPREVSRVLLTRDAFLPAGTVNTLAAAWIQFIVRDWFHHARGKNDDAWDIPLAEDDDWPTPPLLIPRTPTDPTRPAGSSDPPTYVNEQSHWWDASQLYGNSLRKQRSRRTGVDGKLRPADGTGLASAGVREAATTPGFWLGLAMLQILFINEHNAICDRLRTAYPAWTDEELFQRARLVNAALIAKIHTLEWTPAVISHPTTVKGMSGNWYGLLGERIHRLFGRFSRHEVLSGIIGGDTDHFGVPYAMTEEFVAVYRMHPLIPDEWTIRCAADGAVLRKATLPELTGPQALNMLDRHTLADLFYSFGVASAGAVTLHNYPKFLQEFENPDGTRTDLAAADILRTREFGVPRYNEFRRLLRLKPAKDIDALTDNPAWADEIRRIYDNDVERVDLLVGLLAERRPQGFAFSDTAFRIFLLMAARRLNSDRFFTTDYTPEVYTEAGLEWIEENSMVTVLLRHLPQLRPALRSGQNAFQPFQP